LLSTRGGSHGTLEADKVTAIAQPGQPVEREPRSHSRQRPLRIAGHPESDRRLSIAGIGAFHPPFLFMIADHLLLDVPKNQCKPAPYARLDARPTCSRHPSPADSAPAAPLADRLRPAALAEIIGQST
jgi:hypothetical protein